MSPHHGYDDLSSLGRSFIPEESLFAGRFLNRTFNTLGSGFFISTSYAFDRPLTSWTMREKLRNELPEWVWTLAFAAGESSLQYDESMAPKELWQAWEKRLDDDFSQDQPILDLLKTCKPIEFHHFLHCVGNYRALTAEFNVVLRRPDCDRATALMYFAYFWEHYHDGRDECIEEEYHELMSYIRTRAWDGGYKIRKFDVPEATLLELSDMQATLVDNTDHPFNLPAGFVAMSKKEELYHRLSEKIMPRKSYPN